MLESVLDGALLKTRRLQLAFTDPAGPQSSMLTTMSPTIHNTKNMKDPRITMDGNSRRCEISHSSSPRKPMVRPATVMK